MCTKSVEKYSLKMKTDGMLHWKAEALWHSEENITTTNTFNTREEKHCVRLRRTDVINYTNQHRRSLVERFRRSCPFTEPTNSSRENAEDRKVSSRSPLTWCEMVKPVSHISHQQHVFVWVATLTHTSLFEPQKTRWERTCLSTQQLMKRDETLE